MPAQPVQDDLFQDSYDAWRDELEMLFSQRFGIHWVDVFSRVLIDTYWEDKKQPAELADIAEQKYNLTRIK